MPLSVTNQSGVSLIGLQCESVQRITFHTSQASFWYSSNLEV